MANGEHSISWQSKFADLQREYDQHVASLYIIREADMRRIKELEEEKKVLTGSKEVGAVMKRENCLLNIIGGLVDIIVPTLNKNKAELIALLSDKYCQRGGFSERNLCDKFLKAQRNLDNFSKELSDSIFLNER